MIAPERNPGLRPAKCYPGPHHASHFRPPPARRHRSVIVQHDILFTREGGLGLVRLNRPKALNALTQSMCAALDAKLREWEADPSVKAVVVRGAGERAFCAGGDVRHIHDVGRTDRAAALAFFRDEYRMNARIHRFTKPYVSFLDGIVMGGGFGVSVHGSHRVATPRTLFAMPETVIGMFPDVGGSYFLARCPGAVGMYLGLTGARLAAADAIHAGVAQSFVPSGRLDELQHALAEIVEGADAHQAVTGAIAGFSEQAGESALAAQRGPIDRIFALPSVEAIRDALHRDGSPLAVEAAAKIESASPTSLKVAHRLIGAGAQLGFDDCMRMEWRVVNRIVAGHDFYAGVRAALIDKGSKPAWNPATLDAVTEEAVVEYFAPLPAGDLRFDWD